jgi:hypothetical protein
MIWVFLHYPHNAWNAALHFSCETTVIKSMDSFLFVRRDGTGTDSVLLSSW